MTDDSDELRRLIEARMSELGLEAAVVSVRIGKNRGYLFDYLRKGTPRTMPAETKIKLADELSLHPSTLGVAALNRGLILPTDSGFSDDATPFTGGDDFPKMPLHLAPFKVRSHVLDNHPSAIVPGTILVMNLSRLDPESLGAGEIVVVQLFDRHELTRSHGTIFRQFLPPDKLVTNSSRDNDMMSFDDFSRPYTAVIKGSLEYIMTDVRQIGSLNDEKRRT